jgi:hypothetical protein
LGRGDRPFKNMFIRLNKTLVDASKINSIQIVDTDCLCIYFAEPIYESKRFGFDGEDWVELSESSDDSDFSQILWCIEVTHLKQINDLAKALNLDLVG